jgi:hypothetical protein
LYPLSIYTPTFSPQKCRDAPIAEARIPLAKFVQPFRKSRLEAALAFFIPLARSVLPDDQGTHGVPRPQTFLASGGRLGGASSGLKLSLGDFFQHQDVEGLVGD